MRMKIKKIQWVGLFNLVAGILFVASIYLSIKWSDLPVIDIGLFNNSFWVKTGEVDAIVAFFTVHYFL